MAPKPVPNTMAVDCLFNLYGQIVENTYHVESPTGVDAQVLTDCLDMFAGWVTGNLMPHLSQDVSMQGVEVTDLNIPNGQKVVFQPGVVVTGGVAFAAEPGNVSFCVSGRTNRTGRSYRSRDYMIGVPTSVRTGNQVSPGWANDILTAMNFLITALSGINQILVVLSRIQNGIELLVPVTTPITTFTYTDLYIDSQRRRLTNRGT